jgi:general secretion pathway protein M
MITISQQTKGRWLASLILAGALVLAWIVVLGPLANILFGESEDVQHSLALLGRYEALAEARPQVQAELQAMQQRNATMSGLVEGNSAALAAAQVQSDVKAIVERNGGAVLSSQNMPSSLSDNFEKIEIQYDLTVPPGGLKNVIYQIETHSPYLFLDSVNMRMPENWGLQDPGAAVPAMEVQFLVRGYRWVGTK